MADIMRSPRFLLKMKTRDAVNKIKSGSPKFQEVLRQRCRDRMREKRRELFNTRRAVVPLGDDAEGIQNTLTEIVRQEFSDLTTMSVDQDPRVSSVFSEPLSEEEIFQLEAEILADEEEWILKEYEKLLEEDDNLLNIYVEESLKDTVVCPICEKSGLNETPGGLICPACNMCLPPKCSLSQLASAIQSQLDAHSAVCFGQTSFMTLPENNSLSLYITCEVCQCFSLIL
ncbi:RPA-interacting protein [Diachasma alloeum]|uniref:RPA-interacting protein n=1 Tax=Diachasma alloeum TaxID=454923 RepID=UPI0007382E40|nr:RPA-interacting protein [Diachasma alloeum]